MPARERTLLRSDGQLYRLLHRVDRQLPWTARKALRQWWRPAERRSSMVTVVVAVGRRDLRWLEECLDSLCAQSHRNLEILLVGHGSDPVSLSGVQGAALDDWRVRVLPESAPDQGAARNLAAQLARGRYVCFVHPADLLPAGAVEVLVESLDRTGSDFAVGREIHLPTSRNVESTIDPVHDDYVEATTIAEFPLAVSDGGTGNRLYGTAFWRENGLAFPGDGEHGTRPVTVDAYVLARRFDVLPDITYHRMNRAGGVPFGTVVDAMSEVHRWIADQSAVWRSLDGHEATAVRDAWASVLLDKWAVPYVDDVERADGEQWAALRDFLSAVIEVMDPVMWSRVRAENRVKTWLLTHDRRSELEELLSRRWFELGNRPTEVVDGVVRALLPFHDDPDIGVPAEHFVMSEQETRLQSTLRGVRWTADQRLELDLFSYVDFVGSFDELPRIEAFAVSAVSGRRTPLDVEQRFDPDVSVAAGHRYQDYAGGASTVRIDVGGLLATADAPPASRGRLLRVDDSLSEWWLEIRYQVRGLERLGSITQRDERGAAGQLTSGTPGSRDVGDRRVLLVPDPHVGLRIAALPPLETRLVDVQVEGRRVTGSFTTTRSDLVAIVATRSDGTTVRGRLSDSDNGLTTFSLAVDDVRPDLSLAGRVWSLRVVDRKRRRHLVAFPVGEAPVLGGAEGDLVIVRTRSGGCDLSEADRTAVVSSVTIEEGGVRVRGRWPGRTPSGWSARLRNKRFRLPAASCETDGQSFDVLLPTVCDEWGLGSVPVPSGLYFVDLLRHNEGASAVRLLLSDDACDQLLRPTLVQDFRAVVVSHGRDLGVRLAPPLDSGERGPYAQKQLQTWYQTADLPLVEEAVYLQSYTGVAATDSPRALHDELRRSRPDLKTYWGVADRSTQVPDGAVPVIFGSREWYRVLASAKYLCNNIDFDRWFTKRPGQQFLQTFHGYPAKSMGIRLWEAKRFTPRRIEAELDRTSRDWDLILTPTPEMDVHYRTEYRYEGPIESAGYPRDDVLVSGAADTIRQETRRRLGIAAEQTAVLYAPTWRDDLATSYRSAPLVRHLDLESATEQLGEDFVFLMRGHRFHAKGDRRSGRTARLIDVTDYPEINDLILAADAAVLDYSSLRFDFALTGRPMLFLVPDLADYVGGVRGFLYPFEQSAPGPLIDDAEDVVARLRDLDAVREEFADDYVRFHERFNYLQDGRAAARVVQRFFV